MPNQRLDRRHALKSSLAWAGAAIWTGRDRRAWGFQNANDRPRIAAVGTGSRWSQRATGLDAPYGSAQDFRKFGDYVAVCDADADRVDRAKSLVQDWSGMAAVTSADYRAVIDRDDIDIVHISTPDHWHAKIAIEAMLSGKDVYCEKPMTLTIAEGRQLCDVCKRTGRIVQIGTQQRSNRNFIQAIALLRAGRIGQLQRVTCSVGGGPTSPQLPAVDPPKNLDWNLWQGPVADVPFRYLAGNHGETKSWSRCHYEFRWWYEYSGGKLTDWGAHHVDIATWAMNKIATGPTLIDPVMVKHPMDFQDGYPTKDDQYNTATAFLINATFADGMELTIRHDLDNGILLEGTEGRIFVNRGRLTGKAVEGLATNPLPDGALEAVYKDQPLTDHFRNFFAAVAARKEPVSDVFSHHRALSTCHLAAIAARLGRPIKWDPQAEQVLGDQQAQSFISRDRRKGFEIEG
jgi:predicted dehydrogenase